MSEKEVDYGRMLTGLTQGIIAINKHDHALKALKSKLLAIVEEVDMLLAENLGKDARAWYEAISNEHDKAIRDRYEKQQSAAGEGSK